MHELPDDALRPAPVAGRGARRTAWLAAVLVAAAFLATVGAGVLGRLTQPPQPAQVTPGPTAAEAQATARGAAVGPTESIGTVPSATAAAGSAPPVVRVPAAGYEVTFRVDPAQRPSVNEDGSEAVFGFSLPSGSRSYDGTITVSVGTPARGAVVPISGLAPPVNRARIYATTLEDLKIAYLEADPGRSVSRVLEEVDGVLAIMMRVRDPGSSGRATALAVFGNRVFVLSATGFQGLYGDISDNPAQLGLQRFLDGFRFGPALFVSRELGFQAPLPADAKPDGLVAGFPLDQAEGVILFGDGAPRPDGQWSHAIAVSVGTGTHPAFVRALPSEAPLPYPARIWSGTAAGLVSRYRSAVRAAGSGSVDTVLGGEPAVRIDGADGLAVTVMVVHNGRAYIISTTALDAVEAAPGFELLLSGFAFLD